MEEGGGEMRFRLPAAPSPGPLMFLLAACREVARAGGHTTGAVAVQLLQWELGHAVLEAFRCAAPISHCSCLNHLPALSMADRS